MEIQSKLPNVSTSIFTKMSAMAQECGAINLSQGFPNFAADSRLANLVTEAMQNGHNQYAPMTGLPILRQALAQKIEKRYNHPCNADTEITITAGGTQAIFTAIAAFIRPDDEVIIIEPAYDSYAPSVEAFGGKVVTYTLTPPQYQVDWNAFANLISPKTKMIIINTPQNPTGKVLNDNDLYNLEKIIDNTNILLLSDEVYEHLVFDGQKHTSVLAFPNLFKRSLAVFSFGKTFHTTGWKIGYIVAPAHLAVEFRKVHQFTVFSVNTPMQHALAAYLKNAENYEHLPQFYQEKRDFFLEKMKNSRFKPLKSEGTYFQLFNYNQISDLPDTEFCEWLCREKGVAAIPVSAFYTQNAPNDARIIRLCFAKTNETLAEAAAKLSGV